MVGEVVIASHQSLERGVDPENTASNCAGLLEDEHFRIYVRYTEWGNAIYLCSKEGG